MPLQNISLINDYYSKMRYEKDRTLQIRQEFTPGKLAHLLEGAATQPAQVQEQFLNKKLLLLTKRK